MSPRGRNTTHSKWNSFSNINIFFVNRPRTAARIDSWTIKPLCSSEWKKPRSSQGITESISRNKLRYGINKLSRIAEYWRVDNLIDNEGIQNTTIRNRFCEILWNIHFAVNRKDDKTDKDFKMRPVIDHLNSKFFEVLSNDSEKSIDEHMMKFKGRSGMKQYIKWKPIKWGFNFWFCCSSKSGYLYQMDIFLKRKETPKFNLGLGAEVVL